MQLTVTAPGKVVLLGEYVVLEGAPALSMAIDREVRVDVATTSAPVSTVESSLAPGDLFRFQIDSDNRLIWLDQDGVEHFRLLQFVVGLFGDLDVGTGSKAVRNFELFLDSSALYESGRHRDGQYKLGLGSSAALTVATAIGLDACNSARTTEPMLWLNRLVGCHRGFQSGQGSGVDIATSLMGGVVMYSLVKGVPEVDPLTLPSDLSYVFIWSGQSASTPEMLRNLYLWRDGNHDRFNQFVDSASMAADAGISALRCGNSEEFLACAGRFAELLDNLSQQSGVQICSRPHRELAALAMRSGLVYKPCGAGNGDLGIAMSTDAEDIHRFAARALNAGYNAIDLSLNPYGVRIVRSQ